MDETVETNGAIYSGVPKTRDYLAVTESTRFVNLERFSNQFQLSFHREMRGYSAKWQSDSLHHWSRQWEYLYVDSRLDGYVGKNALKILDGGSGITFFPFFLAAKFHSARIDCVDYDPALKGVFGKIKAGGDYSVTFKSADLKKLPYGNDHFDAAYCVSVLEHTRDYSKIIDEFYRVLKVGGRLIVTFDVSLDGTRAIKLGLAEELLSNLGAKFAFSKKIDLENEISHPDIFTSHIAREIDPLLLPWKYPAIFYQVRSLLSGKGIAPWPPLLTVACVEMFKGT
jgi:SAM-dependent methyltransferase